MSEGYPTTFLVYQNPSSVVGADIFPTVLWVPSAPIPNKHGKAPPTCLWVSIVLWVPAFTILGEHGKTNYMPLGINSMTGTESAIPEEDNATSHMHLTLTVLWAPTIILYLTAWATILSSKRTLSLSLVRPSPSSIKGDALSPNTDGSRHDQSHKHRALVRILSARRISRRSWSFSPKSDRTSCTPHLTPFRL